MDELFLQILNANESAQVRIEEAQGATLNSQEVFNELKKTVDREALESFENESRIILEKTDTVLIQAKRDVAVSLQQQKSILEKDFKKVSESHRAMILSEIFHGE